MSSTAGAVERALTAGNAPAVQRQLVAAISLALLALFAGLAVLLLVRRLSGAFVEPLNGMTIVLVVTVVESAAAIFRQIVLRTSYSVLSTAYLRSQAPMVAVALSLILLIVPNIAALAVLASLTIPGTPVWALVFAWFVLIAGEATHWLFYFRPRLRHFRWPRPAIIRSELPAAVEEPEIPVGLVQQVTRILEGGRESIHSLVRAEVPANDRLAVVHLAFCPPLAARPELTAHAMDADDAEIRITQTESFGARFEIRLPQVQESSRSVLIEVLGTVTAPPGD